MSIQEDVLHAIGPLGCARFELRTRTGGYGQDELDVTVNALLRARRVSESFGQLKLIDSKRAVGDMPHTGRPPNAVPTAEEEAAASLQPVIQQCKQCLIPQLLCEFRLLRNIGVDVRAQVCRTCHGKATGNGMAKRRGQVATPVDLNATPEAIPGAEPSAVPVEGSGPLGLQSNEISQREGDNRDVSAERCRSTAANSGTPETLCSDLSEDAQTPAGSGVASPVVGKSVAFNNAQRALEKALNRVTVLGVEMANTRAEVERCTRFIEVYREFEKGEAAA